MEQQTKDQGARDLLIWTFPLAELGGVAAGAVSMLETVRTPCALCVRVWARAPQLSASPTPSGWHFKPQANPNPNHPPLQGRVLATMVEGGSEDKLFWGAAGQFVEHLAEEITAKGGRLVTSSPARHINQDATGVEVYADTGVFAGESELCIVRCFNSCA